MELQKLLSYTRKAVDEYRMIEEGDHIAVGIRGRTASLCSMHYMDSSASIRRNLNSVQSPRSGI